MALYDMICLKCKYEFIYSKPIKDDLPKHCPECGDESLEQDWQAKNLTCMMYRSLGHQGEVNKKEMGSEQYEMQLEKTLGSKKYESIKGKKERPWWRPDSDKPLDVRKVKDVNKYIRTGELS